MNRVPADQVLRDVERALEEDIGSGDVTADLLSAKETAHARVITREPAIICGQAWFDACFHRLDALATCEWQVAEGARASAGAVLCRVSGNARALVTAERSALNFLQTLSATATTTASYVEAIRGTWVSALDLTSASVTFPVNQRGRRVVTDTRRGVRASRAALGERSHRAAEIC